MKSPIKNLIINSVGVFSTSGIAFLMVPAYTSSFGVEGYAVYATWIFVIALCQFLDLGYSTTIVKYSDLNGEKEEFGKKVVSYEFYIVISIFVLVFFSLLVKFPDVGVYSRIKAELGDYAVTLFFLPIFIGNLIKLYSFSYLARGHFFTYNISVLTFESIRQIGGFLALKLSYSWVLFFYYQIISTFIFFLILKLSLSRKYKAKLIYSIDVLKENFYASLDFTKVIFFSSIFGAIMSTFDRLVLTLNFSNNQVAYYSACFIVASVINMAIQPFHRLSLPLFINLYDSNKISSSGDVLTSLSSILSLVSLALAGFMILYVKDYMPLLLSSEYESNMLQIICILSLSFWFIACGWLPANLLQAVGKPNIQMYNMAVALVVGGFISYFLASNRILSGVAAIWFVHGIIQVFFMPYISSKMTKSYIFHKWFFHVVILNFLAISTIYYIILNVRNMFGLPVSALLYCMLVAILLLLNLLRFKNKYAKI